MAGVPNPPAANTTRSAGTNRWSAFPRVTPGARVAIGETVADSKLGGVVGAVLLIFGSLVAGLVLAVVTAARRSVR
jgi:hypothetical protein